MEEQHTHKLLGLKPQHERIIILVAAMASILGLILLLKGKGASVAGSITVPDAATGVGSSGAAYAGSLPFGTSQDTSNLLGLLSGLGIGDTVGAGTGGSSTVVTDPGSVTTTPGSGTPAPVTTAPALPVPVATVSPAFGNPSYGNPTYSMPASVFPTSSGAGSPNSFLSSIAQSIPAFTGPPVNNSFNTTTNTTLNLTDITGDNNTVVNGNNNSVGNTLASVTTNTNSYNGGDAGPTPNPFGGISLAPPVGITSHEPTSGPFHGTPAFPGGYGANPYPPMPQGPASSYPPPVTSPATFVGSSGGGLINGTGLTGTGYPAKPGQLRPI